MTASHHVLVIGVGSIGERHLRCLRRIGRSEVSICEPDAVRTRKVADNYGVARVYLDLDAALRNDSKPITAAVVATPANLHIPMARRLAEAGIHLLIEKPLSTTLEGCADLERTVRQSRVVASVGYVYRAHPAVQSMQQAIANGRFGRPLQILAFGGQHFPKYRPAYRETYYAHRATGGGAIQDALTHFMNLGEFLVGPVDRVMADAAHQALEGVEVEDTVHVLARHGDVLGCYSYNQYQAPDETSVIVVCDRGTARFDVHADRWMSMTLPGGQWSEELTFRGPWDDVFCIQLNRFLDAVEGRCAPFCSLAEGLQTLRVNLAVLAVTEQPGWRRIEQTR